MNDQENTYVLIVDCTNCGTNSRLLIIKGMPAPLLRVQGIGTCTTHHHACDCREAEFAALRAADEKEIRRLTDEVEVWKDRAALNGKIGFALQEKLAEAKEVLEFYAGHSKSEAKRLQMMEGGAKARALLEKWGKG